MPLVKRTLATLRKAEFGFLGVVVNTFTQTPLLKGENDSAGLFFITLKIRNKAGALVFFAFDFRPFFINWLIVGINKIQTTIR